MVNPDSDLARTHPGWIMATGGRLPPEARYQQVLDLGHADAYSYIFERLDTLLSEYDIAYLKWDHNRDLIDAGHSPAASPACTCKPSSCTGCWTSYGPGAPPWRSSRALPAAPASTSAYWNTPTASGPATATTHSNASSSSAGPEPCCHRR